ncbi:PUA domain RNA-binding protein, partial [Spraguea lophii 42_110]
NNEMFIAFKKNKWIPTIKYLNSIIKHHNDNNNNKDGIDNKDDNDKQDNKDITDIIIPFNYILLDAGAYNPLIRGADIMSPGIYKYKHMINIFNKDDILPIIINNEVVAIGITTVDYSDIKEDSKGQAMINIHSKEDELYKKK